MGTHVCKTSEILYVEIWQSNLKQEISDKSSGVNVGESSEFNVQLTTYTQIFGLGLRRSVRVKGTTVTVLHPRIMGEILGPFRPTWEAISRPVGTRLWTRTFP